MAKRGQKPKPRAVRELDGNPGHRPLPPKIDVPVGTTCPPWVSAGAKEEWKRLYKGLEHAGIITQADRAALAAYCVAYDDWRMARQAIKKWLAKYGTFSYRTKSGTVKAIPEIAIARAAQEDMRRWAIELGATPSARTRVSPVDPGTGEDDPLLDFLRGGIGASAPPPTTSDDHEPN
jgi:P27 family predicted phage terminase small subunit